jgi:hypothetical protein
MSEKNRPQVFKDLQSLGGLIPGKQAPAPPARASSDAPAAARFSAKVRRADRAGRAPYNFVPLPKAWREVPEPPRADCYAHAAARRTGRS